ncbi:MAG: ABC transporter substrate-binding protein [Alphaproteobacteria bacterium]|nr:ABC transporter substrate-binding protein [Alphaproteobacteria bacterium]
MKRREVWGGLSAALLLPRAAWAQEPPVPVIGFLNGAAYALSAHLVRSFHAGLGEAGFIEGRNVRIEYRSAEGQYARLPALAADLVSLRVNVIAATGTPTGLPAKAATKSIPIVFVTGSDPVEQGLVVSLNRPEGNLTGATTLAVDLGRKRVELLNEMMPQAKRIGALINPTGPNLAAVMRDLRAAEQTIGKTMQFFKASTEPELEAAFAAIVESRVEGLVIGTDTFFNSQSARLAALALRYRVPAIYQYREFVAAGGLMSYAGSISDAYRVIGTYAGRILKGEKPALLPVQRSTKAELFINLKTAETFDLRVPGSLAARADELLE